MEKIEVIKLLSDSNRYNIFIKLLEYDELCICELEELLSIKQANASKHLKKFKNLGILDSTRDKNLIKYSLKKKFINDNSELVRYLVK